MSSSNRSPKDLRDLIEKSKKETERDMTDIEEALINLRNIPSEEKTEMGLLRSRIEEQSRLIMILKQRGDEYIRKHMAVEKHNKELSDNIERYNFDIKDLERKCDLLNNRFNDLAENHQELIKIKDDYKRNNAYLMEENKKLVLEINRYKASQDSRNEEYIEQIKQLKSKCESQEQLISELKESNEKQRASYQDKLLQQQIEYSDKCREYDVKINDYEIKVENLNAIIKMFETDAKQLTARHEAKLKEVSKERDELLELTIQRGKLLHEKQHENQKLTERVAELDKLVAHLKEKFDLESEKVNANQLIQKLKNDMFQMENQYRNLQMEYDAYKKHTSTLLEREKELNSKLKFLVS